MKSRQFSDDDVHYMVQKFLFMMAIYPNYRVDSRGPSGCIMDILRRLSPETHQKLKDETDPHELLDDEDEET